MTGQISPFFQDVGKALTSARLVSYQPAANATPEDCLANYLWDVTLAESLLPSIHFLEVAYRNTLHGAVGRLIAAPLLGSENWLLANVGILEGPESSRVVKAKEDLNAKRLPMTEANLVDELTLGFWINFLNVRYTPKWPRIIKSVFPHATNAQRNRADILLRMNQVRELRNAIFHHHSVWHWRNLSQIHADLHTVLAWVSAPASQMAKALDRFPQVHQAGWQAFSKQVQGFCVTPPSAGIQIPLSTNLATGEPPRA